MKKNNLHYQNIKLNTKWFNSIESSELSTLLNYETEDDDVLSQSFKDTVDEREEDTRGKEMWNCGVHGTKDYSASQIDNNVAHIEMDYSMYGNDHVTQNGCLNRNKNEITNVHPSDDKFNVSGEGNANRDNGMGTVTCVKNGHHVMRSTDDCSDDDSELEEDSITSSALYKSSYQIKGVRYIWVSTGPCITTQSKVWEVKLFQYAIH